jgi:hypothetical protein
MSKTLDDAIALFRAGHSPRECEKLTGINFMKVVREAKKRGVEKGDLIQLTSSIARDTKEFVTLSVTDKQIVTECVAKHLEGMKFYSTEARNVVKKGVESFMADPNPNGMKTTLDGMKSGMQVEGLVPFYQSAQQINNTNAQQNNTEEKRRVFHVVE